MYSEINVLQVLLNFIYIFYLNNKKNIIEFYLLFEFYLKLI